MQTFLPYADFVTSAQVLDRQRLGKQRVETLQILRALAGVSKGWTNHPATKMWRGHESLLVQYGVAMCDEWTGRGYKDTCKDKIIELGRLVSNADSSDLKRESAAERFPGWLGDLQFHISHQSNLLRKDKNHYSKYFSNVPDDLPYVWPEGPTGADGEANVTISVSE